MREESDGENQRELFGGLFGFKVGDRVKYFQRYFWRNTNSTKEGYWRYGKVIRSVVNWENIGVKKEPTYRVRFSDDSFSRGFKAKDLVRCRKYERR